MKISKVLIATKTTLLELGEAMHAAAPLKRLLLAGDPLVADQEPCHNKTVQAREIVRKALEDAGIAIEEFGRPGKIRNSRYDLIVAVGGDGTVLDISRFVDGIPVIAVNSSPSTSQGHFCAVTADKFAGMLSGIMSGEIEPARLTRLSVSIDGKRHPQPALNDALLANVVPSATSRYCIQVGGDVETQKSSGVWISTAAGSTGAIFSAGGLEQKITDNRLQYRVREPFGCRPERSLYSLTSGILGPDGISFVSRMIRGGVYLDGRRVAVPVDFGSVVKITADGPPLNLFVKR
jgi:NAD+ kinase